MLEVTSLRSLLNDNRELVTLRCRSDRSEAEGQSSGLQFEATASRGDTADAAEDLIDEVGKHESSLFRMHGEPDRGYRQFRTTDRA